MKGHEWEANGLSFIRGTWCKLCGYEQNGLKERRTIDDMQARAKRHGGRCVSTVYLGSRHKLECECAHGHRWFTKPATVRMGHWCPQCANLRQFVRADSKARLKYEASGAVAAKRASGKTGGMRHDVVSR